MASRASPFIGGVQPRLTCWIGILPSFRKKSSRLLPRTCPLTSITGQGIEGCISCAGNCTAAAIIITAVITPVAVIVAVIPSILPLSLRGRNFLTHCDQYCSVRPVDKAQTFTERPQKFSSSKRGHQHGEARAPHLQPGPAMDGASLPPEKADLRRRARHNARLLRVSTNHARHSLSLRNRAPDPAYSPQ